MGTPRHGHRPKGRPSSPTYQSWSAMKSRCCCPSAHAYSEYGGRGITIFPKWLRFEWFLEDMGERPEGTTLDRYPDQNGNYEPGNVRWATPTQQQRNTRQNVVVTFNGVSRCISEWSEVTGINKSTLMCRLFRSGWSTEKALTTPALSPRERKHGCPA